MKNRDFLLECALYLFAERSYDGVGVREICQAAGVTKPTLYHYFGSKRGLLEALATERYAPFVMGLGETARYDGDLPRTMRQVTDAFFQFGRREPLLWRLLLSLWFASPVSEAATVMAPLSAAQRAIAEELFRAAGADHGNMHGRERAIAMSFLGMVYAHIGMALDGDLELDTAAAQQAVQRFSYGIYA